MRRYIFWATPWLLVVIGLIAVEITRPPKEPQFVDFNYHGLALRFASREVRVANTEGYARLKPKVLKVRNNSFIELGRERDFARNSKEIRLSNGYELWCAPLGNSQERGLCTAPLRSMPIATLLFSITSPPSDAEAQAAIIAAEEFLIKAKITP